MVDSVSVPVSVGELFDKISILEIKSARIADDAKLKNIRLELSLLREVANALPNIGIDSSALEAQLKSVNETIWDLEERIRELEKNAKYDGEFIATARAIHKNNDLRSKIKKELNVLMGSSIVEEKSYGVAGRSQ